MASSEINANGIAKASTRMSQATTSAIVTVIVGGQKTYYIHKSVLTSVSKYFQAALERDFVEAHEKKIDLPHVDTETFDIFVDWIYSSKLEAIDANIQKLAQISDGDVSKKPLGNVIFLQISKICIFADGHEVSALRRIVVDTAFDFLDGELFLPCYETIHYIFDRLPTQSPLLQLSVDFYCKRYAINPKTCSRQMARAEEHLPREFLLAVFIRHSVMLMIRQAGKCCHDGKLNACDYHEHTNQDERDKCGRKAKEVAP